MIVAAIISGAAWRRWWGDERPSWAFTGFRGMQASIGLGVLFGLCLWAGHPWWASAIRSGLAIGFLAACAQSIPHVWMAWDALDSKVRLPKLGRWFTGWTTFAEATAGALVWGLALWA